MTKSKEYKAIKNFIHNELNITKEDIVKTKTLLYVKLKTKKYL